MADHQSLVTSGAAEAHRAGTSDTAPQAPAVGSSRRRTRRIVVVGAAVVGMGAVAVSGYMWATTSHQTWTAIVNDSPGPVTVTECLDRACTVPASGGGSVAMRAGDSYEHLVGDTSVTWVRLVAPDGARCLELATAGTRTPMSAIPIC